MLVLVIDCIAGLDVFDVLVCLLHSSFLQRRLADVERRGIHYACLMSFFEHGSGVDTFNNSVIDDLLESNNIQ